MPVPISAPLPSTPEVGTEADRLVLKREQQLATLVELGFRAPLAAPYCDGVTPVDRLVDLIMSDIAVLEEKERAAGGDDDASGGAKQSAAPSLVPLIATPRPGSATPRGSNAKSSTCLVA